jgi:hypothetical protein
MMDPLTALSIAGTIVQFVDFSTKLLADGSRLYKSANGALSINQELDLVANDLRRLIQKLQMSFYSDCPTTSTPDEDEMALRESFEKICDEATLLADQLVDRLEKLKVDLDVKGAKRIWKSIHQAVISAWNQKEVNELTGRLLRLKAGLETRVLLSVR